jgi:hypothetical protein
MEPAKAQGELYAESSQLLVRRAGEESANQVGIPSLRLNFQKLISNGPCLGPPS